MRMHRCTDVFLAERERLPPGKQSIKLARQPISPPCPRSSRPTTALPICYVFEKEEAPLSRSLSLVPPPPTHLSERTRARRRRRHPTHLSVLSAHGGRRRPSADWTRHWSRGIRTDSPAATCTGHCMSHLQGTRARIGDMGCLPWWSLTCSQDPHFAYANLLH